MSAWLAIFQQQFAPAIPQVDVTSPPERVELSLTRNVESTAIASDIQASDQKSTAAPATSLDSLLAPGVMPSAKLIAVPVAAASGDEASDPLKTEPAAELTPKNAVAQPSILALLTRLPFQSAILAVAETAQPLAPPAALIAAPALEKNTTAVAPRPTSGPLSELLAPTGELHALSTEIGLTRSIPQRFSTKSNEVVAKFLSENSTPKPEPQTDSTAEPIHEEEAVDLTPVRAEQAPRNDKPETPIEVAAKELPTQSPSPLPAEPHAPAAVLAGSVPQARVESSLIAQAPVPPTETPVARPAPPPPQLQPTPTTAAKTISIRIPFTSTGKGEGAQHIDLIFQNRNNDLTLQLHSPTTEIQQRIEESMPTLMGKLQTADWTAKPAESSVAEPMLDSRKRAETSTNSPLNFESTPALAQSGSSAQSGSRFDQNTSNRKENPPQAQPGRNRKKDRAWQFEIDSETES